MRNVTLKIILLFLVSSIGIGVYIWVNNFMQIDLIYKKTDFHTMELISELENSNDIEFIREEAIRSVTKNKEQRHRKSNYAVFQSKVILLQAVLILISIILGIIQLVKQKTLYNRVGSR